ncbi:MAG: hypothetical protein Q8K63_04600 [Acidimicrobiales bacterium]|nr:hypothetical protein [Acidimicrobiales bacterium]
MTNRVELQYVHHRAQAAFRFAFVPNRDAGWLVQILSHPDADGRPEGMTDIHWLPMIGGPGRRVCFTGHLGSIEEAMTLAARWAEGFLAYRSGQLQVWGPDFDASHVRWDESDTARAEMAGASRRSPRDLLRDLDDYLRSDP